MFLGSEFYFDTMVGLLVAPQEVVVAQSLVLGASVIGFLLFAPLHRAIAEPTRMTVSLLACVVLVGCLLVVSAHVDVPTTLVAGCVAFAALGLAGADAHWKAAIALHGSRFLARGIGVAYATGLLLQFALNLARGHALVEVAALSISVAGMAALLCIFSPGPTRGKVSSPTSQTKAEKPPRRHVLCLVGAVILAAILFVMLDNVVTFADAGNHLDVETLPRLLLAVSALFAGWLGDRFGRRSLTFATFCATMLSTFAILALENGLGYLPCLVIFYISSGFFVVFFTTSFMDLAPVMEVPELWAGMGRVLNNAMAIAISAPSLMLISSGSMIMIVGLYILVFVGIAAFLFEMGDLPGETANKTRDPSDDVLVMPDATARLALFSAEHGLTQREQQVLPLLVEVMDRLLG